MKISAINNSQSFTSQDNNKIKSKNEILEKFYTGIKYSADMTDTILVPRTIFKGYLGIMSGTTLLTIGSLLTSKLPKLGKSLSITGLLASLYGTFAFVRPYLLKDAPGVSHSK